MRLPTILFATAVCAALVTPAFPQARLPGGRTCQTSPDGALTMKFTPAAPVRMVAVTGAPYSAVESQQSVQTLADGTHLTTQGRDETATWRDSAGRERTETHAPPGEEARPCDSSLAMIKDPVAGYVYLLDAVGQVAYRLPLTTLPPNPPRAAAPAPPKASPLDPTITTESLGGKTMFGITVTGTTRTMTYPIGSKMGNDRPVANSEETWTSPQLGLVVYSQQADFYGRVSTFTLKDLSVAEPDPSLLQVPPGYKIIDESGPFTVEIPSHN
jgi:hypothetical protein